jgi:uncharacterized membrane protein
MTDRRWHSKEAFLSTLRDLRNHSSTSLFTAGILALPALFASLAQTSAFRTGPRGFRFDLASISLSLTLTLVSWFTIRVWLRAAIISATDDYAAGSDPGVGGLLSKSATSRLFSLLGTVGLIGLLFLGAALVASLPLLGVLVLSVARFGSLVLGGRFGALFGVAILLSVTTFVLLATLIFFRYAMAPMVNVLEKTSPTAALARSREILRGRWPDLLVLYVILLGVGLFLALVFGGPSILISLGGGDGPGSLFNRFLGPSNLSPGAALVVALSNYLVQVAGAVINTGALTNFYLRLRPEETLERLRSHSPG